eukprot:CAMPEP_0194218690 /NCGR_PEP_ID=MMETSP0156-20130528/24385_1 /TAXON_ID=33649 /ORGANISM="Thalassionema nitzschioides, Strain L26-B" /LENGTH=664 /DNA_ID=CAMNT_0038948147 /DNA_START=84 /DNA_END=2075 /DNA_ORIENTATION=-
MKLLAENARKGGKKRREEVINATSKDDCGRYVVFQEVSLLNDINNKRSMASGFRNQQAECPRVGMKYIHPEIFFLGETRLNDSLNWCPVKKKIPPLSQLLEKEDDDREARAKRGKFRRDAVINDLMSIDSEYLVVPFKRSNSTSSALSNMSYRSILSSRLFGDDGEESLEHLSYLEDGEKEDDSFLDDSEASIRYSHSDALTPQNKRQSVVEEVRRFRRGSILSTFGTIASNPIEEASCSDNSEELSLEQVFPQRRESRRHSILSALSTFSSVSEAILEGHSDDDEGEELDVDRSIGRSRSDSISIDRSIVAQSIEELNKSKEIDFQRANSPRKSKSSQEKDIIEQHPSIFQEKTDILIENMHKSDISCLSLQLEDLAVEQGSQGSRIKKIGTRRRSHLGRRVSDRERFPNESINKPNHRYEDSHDLYYDQSSQVSRSDSISRARSIVTETIDELSNSKELDNPQCSFTREKCKRESMYQEKGSMNDTLNRQLNKSNSSGLPPEFQDLANDQPDSKEIQPKKSALYRRMSMVGGPSDHATSLNRRLSMIGGPSDHGKTWNDSTDRCHHSTNSNDSQTVNQNYSSAIHRRMSMVNTKMPKRQSIIDIENASIVSSDYTSTTPRTISPTYDIKHEAVSKWRAAAQKFNNMYVDLQIQSSTWSNMLG